MAAAAKIFFPMADDAPAAFPRRAFRAAGPQMIKYYGERNRRLGDKK
jgi:hypothetical protein